MKLRVDLSVEVTRSSRRYVSFILRRVHRCNRVSDARVSPLTLASEAKSLCSITLVS